MRATHRKKKKVNGRFYIFLAVVAVVLIIVVASLFKLLGGGNDGKSGGTFFSPKEKIESFNLSLLCVGDIMEHSTQLKAQYDSAAGTYDFNNNYAYVKPFIEAADVAMCNVETVFADKEPMGYPVFNAPDSLADAIKAAGFDVAFTANNHMLDQGSEGVKRSVDVLRDRGFTVVGSKKEGENNYAIIESKGVKIGMVAYTYETTGTGGTRTINAIKVPDAVANEICSFNPAYWDRETDKIIADLKAAREAGADILVCYLHWGEEYHTEPNRYQIGMAEKIIAESGVDVIFASHPHVLQPAEIKFNETEGKNVALFYSMGNFISNQRYETLQNRLTEDGMMAQVDFEITKSDDKISKIELVKSSALPTWVNRYGAAPAYTYEIVPLTAEYQNNQSLTASGNVSDADKAVVDSLRIIGGSYPKDAEGRIIMFDKKAWLKANGYDENGQKIKE